MTDTLTYEDLYFWLDAEDGSVEGLVHEEFVARIKEYQDKLFNWENVIVGDN